MARWIHSWQIPSRCAKCEEMTAHFILEGMTEIYACEAHFFDVFDEIAARHDVRKAEALERDQKRKKTCNSDENDPSTWNRIA